MRKNGRNSDEREPQTIDGETGQPDPTPPADAILGRGDLSTLRDVRIAIAKVIRGETTGKVEHNRARGLVWMLRELAGVIEVAELERRVRELESRTGTDSSVPMRPALPARSLN